MSYGGGGTRCSTCTKPVYAAESKVAADGKSWHVACFKCTQCKSQLTLSTWAQLNGENTCKPCYKKLFSLRGSYNDVSAALSGVPLVAPKVKESAAVVEAKSAGEGADAAKPPTAAVPAPAIAPKVVAVIEPVAEKAAGEEGGAVAAEESTSAEAVAATEAPTADASDAAAKTQPTAILLAKPALNVPAKAAAAPAPTTTTALPSPTASKAPSKPSAFGGGNKCACCEKAVYAADPQFATDGRTFHKTCFKCLVCKGQLGLSALAQIEGFILCKTCYKAEFKLRGKYSCVSSRPGCDPQLPVLPCLTPPPSPPLTRAEMSSRCSKSSPSPLDTRTTSQQRKSRRRWRRPRRRKNEAHCALISLYRIAKCPRTL